MVDHYDSILIDVSGLAHAARHANSGMSTSLGIPTCVIYHCLTTALHLGLQYRTNQIIWCFDSFSSKRKELYPEYKKSRRNTKYTAEELKEIEDMRSQIEDLRIHLLPAIGFGNILHCEGLEADDVIASYVLDNPAKSKLIVSTDGDLYQLLDKAHMLAHHHMTEQSLIEKYGLRASQWAMFKTICGCRTDDVPGVAGVGEKKATAYLLGTLKETTSYYQKIVKATEDGTLELMAKLVTLPFEGTPSCFHRQDSFSKKGFIKVCTQYEFNSFLLDSSLSDWRRFFKGAFDNAESNRAKTTIHHRNRSRKNRRHRVV